MREELQSELQIRNWMMEFADMLIPELKRRIVDDRGINARYISVHDLTVTFQDYQEVIQFHCKVHYLSDIGDFVQQIMVRYFHSLEHYTLECAQYDRLLSRTKFFDHIEPVELLLRNDKDQTLVYNAPTGNDLRDIQDDDGLYYFQIGHLLAILHGGETLQLQSQEYVEMSKYLINQLPFDSKSSALLSELIEHQFDLIESSYAGYDPVTLIELSNFRFLALEENITKQKIIDGKAYYIQILPSLAPRFAMDRMEDFATIFTKPALWEYHSKGEVTSTIENLLHALEGYEIYFNTYSTAPFDKIYPNGISLGLHILLGVWMFVLEMEENPNMQITTEELISFSLNILYHKVFEL